MLVPVYAYRKEIIKGTANTKQVIMDKPVLEVACHSLLTSHAQICMSYSHVQVSVAVNLFSKEDIVDFLHRSNWF